MGAVIHYPKFYHYAGKADSDKDWIMARMAVIPPEKQEEVAREYERRFCTRISILGAGLPMNTFKVLRWNAATN